MNSCIMCLLASAGLAGCFTTKDVSSVGPFVRTIRPRAQALSVERCTISRAQTTEYNIISALLISPATTTTTRVELEGNNCVTTIVRTGPP